MEHWIFLCSLLIYPSNSDIIGQGNHHLIDLGTNKILSISGVPHFWNSDPNPAYRHCPSFPRSDGQHHVSGDTVYMYATERVGIIRPNYREQSTGTCTMIQSDINYFHLFGLASKECVIWFSENKLLPNITSHHG